MHSGSAPSEDGLYAALVKRGMSRRSFVKFTAAMAAALALPAAYAPRIARAVEAAPRLPVVWLSGQSCGGDTVAFMQSPKPTTAELLLDLLAVDYVEALMTAAGTSAGMARTDLAKAYPNGYLAVVDGAIPTAEGGTFATVGGRTFDDIAREVCARAIGTIALGSCAFDGGAPAASGGRTGARGAAQVVSSPAVVTLPGCPVNVENLSATIVHYLTFKQFPVTDGRGRPLFAYGGLIHNQCERRAHFEFGEFVLSWGDEGAQKGWCLYKMGCKGPETFADCPTVRYAEKASWPVKAGHGCIGCTMPGFWDAMGPAYRRLPSPTAFAPGITADQVGAALVGGVAAMTVVHGTVSYVRNRRNGGHDVHGERPSVEPPDEAPQQPERAPEGPDEMPDEAPGISPWEEPWTEPAEPGEEPAEPGEEPAAASERAVDASGATTSPDLADGQRGGGLT